MTNLDHCVWWERIELPQMSCNWRNIHRLRSSALLWCSYNRYIKATLASKLKHDKDLWQYPWPKKSFDRTWATHKLGICQEFIDEYLNFIFLFDFIFGPIPVEAHGAFRVWAEAFPPIEAFQLLCAHQPPIRCPSLAQWNFEFAFCLVLTKLVALQSTPYTCEWLRESFWQRVKNGGMALQVFSSVPT